MRVKWREFGRDVRKLRTEQALSVRDMARMYHISPATISRADRGLVVSAETFLVLASYFLDKEASAYLR